MITIDFHGSTLKFTLEITRSVLVYCATKKKSNSHSVSAPKFYVVKLIFGLGSHSANCKPVLFLTVCKFLEKKYICYEKSFDNSYVIVKI